MIWPIKQKASFCMHIIRNNKFQLYLVLVVNDNLRTITLFLFSENQLFLSFFLFLICGENGSETLTGNSYLHGLRSISTVNSLDENSNTCFVRSKNM